MEKVIGMSKITTNNRITLPQNVVEYLNVGNGRASVVFKEIDGRIVITCVEA